jgi:hypothetical protein
MTLREAAVRASRSITTLRRYIRSGRLKAQMKTGRYGPEYLVTPAALAEAGIEIDPVAPETSPPEDHGAHALERIFHDSVPLGLYHELQMKHEQLLVQYGMVRAGGLRLLEIQGELEKRGRLVEEHETEIGLLREKLRRDTTVLRKRLRETELELEGRKLEVAALRAKVRALEMLTRNAVTSEAIERQFSEVAEQTRRVDDLRTRHEGEGRLTGPWGRRPRKDDAPEH